MPPSSALLSILVLLLLKERFLEAPTESVTVLEGQDLDLHCVAYGDNTSVLQWSKPPFTIFLGRHRGLKDTRYQLINSSMDRLSVRISNVTTEDEGLYTCYHYGTAGTAKRVNVTILAAPSKPLLEESTIRAYDKEEMIILRCSTQKSKPRPQITWLLDNGIELFGDTHHHCEQKGKKCNSTSSLKVHIFNQKSTIICVVRHKALGGGNLTAAIHLRRITNILNVTEENFRTQRPSLSSEADTPNSTTTNDMSAGSDNVFDITQGSPRTQVTPTRDEAGTLNFTALNDPDKILNVTDGNFSTQTLSPIYEAATLNSNVTSGTNVTYERILKKPSKLLPILVATLLSILSVAVLLLLVKLWKAHREWKRENDSSDPTLENYKARPNEDNHAQNRHVASWRSSKKNASEESWRTSSKNSEESNGSVFEKQLPYIKGLNL